MNLGIGHGQHANYSLYYKKHILYKEIYLAFARLQHSNVGVAIEMEYEFISADSNIKNILFLLIRSFSFKTTNAKRLRYNKKDIPVSQEYYR